MQGANKRINNDLWETITVQEGSSKEEVRQCNTVDKFSTFQILFTSVLKCSSQEESEIVNFLKILKDMY